MVLSRGLVLVLVPFGDLVWVLALSRGLVPPRGMALVLSRGLILVLYRALVLVPSTGLALALPQALLHARLDPCCAKHRAPKPGIGVRLSPVTAPSRVREHRAASGCGGKEGSGGLQEEQGKGEQSRGGVEMGMGCRQGSPTASERSDVRIGGKGGRREHLQPRGSLVFLCPDSWPAARAAGSRQSRARPRRCVGWEGLGTGQDQGWKSSPAQRGQFSPFISFSRQQLSFLQRDAEQVLRTSRRAAHPNNPGNRRVVE